LFRSLLLGLRGLFLLLGLLGLFGLLRLAAVLRLVALARAAAVVRRVEARALEVHRYRVEHALEGSLAADLADVRGRLAHPLEELEQVPVGAAVLVDRHCS